MGAITFTSPPGSALNAINLLKWKSPVQAAFAFFAAPQINVHAVPNQARDAAHEVSTRVSPKLPRSVTPPAFKNAAALSDKPLPDFARVKVNTGRADCLKILREFEPGKCRSSTGRLVISGRMADVCAALDRMALQSATSHYR